MITEELYIPVPIYKQGYKRKPSVILVSVKNCPITKAQLPQEQDVMLHLQAQQIRVKQGQPFSTIKILVPTWTFQAMLREISKKIGRTYHTQVIDLIAQSGQLPLIQILIDKEARRKRLN
jgi:hypothetical protein